MIYAEKSLYTLESRFPSGSLGSNPNLGVTLFSFQKKKAFWKKENKLFKKCRI